MASFASFSQARRLCCGDVFGEPQKARLHMGRKDSDFRCDRLVKDVLTAKIWMRPRVAVRRLSSRCRTLALLAATIASVEWKPHYSAMAVARPFRYSQCEDRFNWRLICFQKQIETIAGTQCPRSRNTIGRCRPDSPCINPSVCQETSEFEMSLMSRPR